MPLGPGDYFLFSLLFVFLLSGLVMLLTTRPPTPDIPDEDMEGEIDEGRAEFDAFAELEAEIQDDEEILATITPPNVPHIDLPDVMLGGGAAAEACSMAAGAIALELTDDPNEKRKSNRRMADRRASTDAVDEERRIVQRRVWLRREEDHSDKQLLSIIDAADTLGVPVEQIYRWLDEVDIPFYQVSENKRKTIQFDINELLHWHSRFNNRGGTSA